MPHIVPSLASRVHHAWNPAPEILAQCDASRSLTLAPPTLDAATRAAADSAVALYRARAIDYREQIQQYSTAGDYLNYGQLQSYERDPTIRRDALGIPMIEYSGEFYYNPVTVAQYVLTLYGRYLEGGAGLSDLVRAADFLLTLQSPGGGFRQPYPYTYYLGGEVLEPGWVSGLAQGQALSALARAYLATGDQRYRDAGDRALQALATPAAEGGPLGTLAELDGRLAERIWFHEYPGNIDAYTLNGFMYITLGLYDWWQLEPSAKSGSSAIARRYFECAMSSLLAVLPLYDFDGFSVYDLGYRLRDAAPNFQPEYHALHISLLHALRSVTGEQALRTYEQRWIDDVSGP